MPLALLSCLPSPESLVPLCHPIPPPLLLLLLVRLPLLVLVAVVHVELLLTIQDRTVLVLAAVGKVYHKLFPVSKLLLGKNRDPG